MKFYIITIILFTFALANEEIINTQVLFDSGEYIEAKDMFETITEKNEDIFYLGYQIYYKLDDLNKANEYLQQAVKANEDKYIEEGDNLGFFINELKNAKVTLDNGFFEEAIEELELLLDKYPNNSIVNFRLGYAYKEKKNYEKAAQYFKEAKRINPYNLTYSEIIVTLAKIQESLGQDEYTRQDYQLALQYFNKALEFDSTYAPVMFRIGNIYYKIKDYDLAIEYYRNGIKNSDLSPKKYKYLNQLGKFYAKANNNEKAVEVFDKVLDIQPGYVPALFEKSKIFKSQGNVDDSKTLLLQITNIDPTYVASYELLMDIEKDLKNYDQALTYGSMCLDFNSTSHTVNARMATIYNETSDFEKAKKYAKDSIKTKRKYAPALFELGYAEMSLCNKVAAKDAFNKAKLDKRFRKVANDYIKNLDLYTKECNN